jgi:mono/diheme cytochrome c family protein
MTRHDQRNEPEQAGRRPAYHDDFPTETIDVGQIHMRIVSQEHLEPEEGLERPPWWLWAFSVILLFAMGFYIGRYSGSFSAAAHEVEEPPTSGQQVAAAPDVRGDQVFAGVCQPCHQSHGSGIPGQYPPLAGSEWLLADHETPVRVLLHGLAGPIVVKGRAFNNRMPAFHDKLSNEEVAAVITWVRSQWGNNAPAVTSAQVDSIRQKTEGRGEWSAAELAKLRAPKLTQK